MKLNLYFSLFISSMLFLALGCGPDDDENPPPPPPPPVDTSVKIDLASMPYEQLSEYRFFVGDDFSEMNPNEGMLLYEPISTLFSDYAHKIRYVWMPEGASANIEEDHRILDFPDGAVIIKTFYYDNVLPTNERRIIETRVLYKENGEWKFAEYVWNDEQTEANLDLSGSNTFVEFTNDANEVQAVNYRIPAEAQCLTCHKMGEAAIPIGPKPQNLNADFDYPDGSTSNQLMKWYAEGYLSAEPNPASINTVVKWDDPALDITLRVRSYLDINCAHCHREGGHCDYRDIRLGFNESDNAEALGICITPQEFLDGTQRFIVNPTIPSKSAMFYRLNSTAEEVRMPLLGRSVVHQEGLEMIESWINQLDDNCD